MGFVNDYVLHIKLIFCSFFFNFTSIPVTGAHVSSQLPKAVAGRVHYSLKSFGLPVNVLITLIFQFAEE